MDEEAFTTFLRRGGRSPSASGRAIGYVRSFEAYLAEHGLTLDDADPAAIESYVAAVESAPGATAKLDLWGIRYYYEFLDDVVMAHTAGELRRERVERTPFPLRQFRGVDTEHTDRLSASGIRFARDLRKEGRTPQERQEIVDRTGVPLPAVEDLVRLSDLARITGLKGIRARLYLDGGVESVADLATRDPELLVVELRDFVESTGFEGVPPLPGEVRSSVDSAKKLPALIEW
jgi:hypothetical protein